MRGLSIGVRDASLLLPVCCCCGCWTGHRRRSSGQSHTSVVAPHASIAHAARFGAQSNEGMGRGSRAGAARCIGWLWHGCGCRLLLVGRPMRAGCQRRPCGHLCSPRRCAPSRASMRLRRSACVVSEAVRGGDGCAHWTELCVESTHPSVTEGRGKGCRGTKAKAEGRSARMRREQAVHCAYCATANRHTKQQVRALSVRAQR